MTNDSGSGSERLCALSDIPDQGALGLEAHVDGAPEALVLLRSGEEVRAFLNVCPHAGRRLDWAPQRFLIGDGLLVCAAHGAGFTIPDGQCVSGPCRGQRLREVPLELHAGEVRVLRTPG